MSAVDILVTIKNMALHHTPFQKTEIYQQYSDASDYIEELEHIYQLMQSCTHQRINHADSSQILWLKDELTLLIRCFEFCRNNGMKIHDISVQLSSEGMNLFPKGPSVIMRMYYQLINHGIPANHIFRKKDKRKKRQKDGSSLQKNNSSKLLHSSQKLKEISKHLRYIEHIDRRMDITNLLDELHTLTSLAAKKSEHLTENTQSLKQVHSVKHELLKEKQELEHTLHKYQMTVGLIKRFMAYSDMEKIEQIPEFTKIFQNLMRET